VIARSLGRITMRPLQSIRRRIPRRVAELVFCAIVGGLRSQKYEGGKSASGARQSRCDVGAV